MSRLLFGAVALALSCSMSMAQPVSFKDKTITVIVASPPGGGTDNTARVIAASIGAELPGKPALVVRNIPGADGITAMNYFVQQVVPDGLTAIMGSSTQSDPHHYRNTNSKYDPVKFRIVGGIGRGGTVVIVRADAIARLHDPKAPPIVMGSVGGIPRSGMQSAAWGIGFLGWNAKWVIGYRGTNDLVLALERGEIDLTSTANMNLVDKLVKSGKFKILVQSGALENGKLQPRPEFGDAPVLGTLLTDALKDPSVKKGYDYWESLTSIDKWMALPEQAPQPIVDSYREAFARASKTKEFVEAGRKISEDFEPMDWQAVELFLRTLGSADKDAIGFMNQMLRKQGLKVDND